MKVGNRLHLTYCLNVHPGETWEENFAAIRDKTLKVRDLVAPKGPFGLGLRLGHEAAQTLSRPENLARFRGFLDEQDLYVFTINGFPYGRFHRAAVKEDVYRPDWRTPERRDYTILLCDILGELVPAGVTGSISTVPGSYKQWLGGGDDIAAMVANLTDVAAHLAGLRERTGRQIWLALEPEPDCYIETTSEAIEFFTGPLAAGAQNREVIRRHLGVCFDTAHLAVAFEDLGESLARLREAEVPVPKIQLSAAVRVAPAKKGSGTFFGNVAFSPGKSPFLQKRYLTPFCDEVYLHQVKVRGADGNLRSYPDLPQAIQAQAGGEQDEWRVHFHVPLFFDGSGPLGSTNSLIDSRFVEAVNQGASEHLEIETYTFDVLPPALRAGDVTESIAREYQWVLERLGQ